MQAILTRKVSAVATLAGAMLLALLGALALNASWAAASHLPNETIAEGNDDANGAAVCFVNGAAGIAPDPVDSVAHDTADDDEAWDSANLTDTDGGSFGFASDAVVCAGEDDGGEVVGTTAGTDFTIEAGDSSRVGEAEYTNKVCGTGHAEGTADLLRGGPAPTNLKTSFSIFFVGGVGQLKITGFEGHIGLDVPLTPGGNSDPDENPGPPALPDVLQDIDTGIGNGVVHIAPTAGANGGPPNPDGNNDPSDEPPGSADPDPGSPGPGNAPCLDQDVTEFTVDAAFEATLSGDTDVANEENEDVPAT